MKITDEQWKSFDNFLTSVDELKYVSVCETLLEVAKAYREDSRAAREEIDRLNKQLQSSVESEDGISYKVEEEGWEESSKKIERLRTQLVMLSYTRKLVRECAEIALKDNDPSNLRIALQEVVKIIDQSINDGEKI